MDQVLKKMTTLGCVSMALIFQRLSAKQNLHFVMVTITDGNSSELGKLNEAFDENV